MNLEFTNLDPAQATALIASYEAIMAEDVNSETHEIITPAVTETPRMADIPTPPTPEVPLTTPDAPIPTISTPAEPQATGDGELDVNGVPWHSDHHAKTKTRKADGSWTRRRGGDKAAADAWEAQHRGVQPAADSVNADTPTAPAAPTAPALPLVSGDAIGYETHIYPLWQKLHAVGKIPLSAIDAVLIEHGVPGAYTEINSNATIRAKVYEILAAVAV